MIPNCTITSIACFWNGNG